MQYGLIRKNHINQNGFTLIELVMILVLLAIIAAVAIPRMVDVASMNAAAFSDKLRADIRYAQNLAMTRNQRVRWAIVAANAYSITIAGNPVIDPATGRNYPVTLDAGMVLNSTNLATSSVEFDSLGVPYDGAAVVGLNANATVTITSGATTQTITITPQTGAVN